MNNKELITTTTRSSSSLNTKSSEKESNQYKTTTTTTINSALNKSNQLNEEINKQASSIRINSNNNNNNNTNKGSLYSSNTNSESNNYKLKNLDMSLTSQQLKQTVGVKPAEMESNNQQATQQDEEIDQQDITNKTNINENCNEDVLKNELALLNQYVNEKQERIKFKLELKQKNTNIDLLRHDESQMKKLDSSIKKVTAFIKRLKMLTESQKDTLGKEMSQLNLSKYLSEVAAAFTEAKLKMNDVTCAVQLCSQMHQNYSEFSGLLFEQWQKLLNIKKDEKINNPSKLRVDLRLFAELITVGVLPGKESLSLLGNQLTVLTTYDKDHSNISIISSFCKHCGEDFADLIPTKYEQLAEKHKIELPHNNLYSAERQKAVKSLFKEYYRSLVQHVLNDHKDIQKLERQNKKTYQTKGELNADKKDKYEQAVNTFKKLIENAEVFADLLGETMPELPADESNKKDDETINIDIYTPGGRYEDFDSNTSPWEDEETRQFYESIPDLKALVPGILYKDSEKPSGNQQANKSLASTSGSEITGANTEETPALEQSNKDKITTKEQEATTVDDLAVEMAQIEKEIQELEKQVDSNLGSNLDDEQNELSIINDEKDAEALIAAVNEDESIISNSNSTSGGGASGSNSISKSEPGAQTNLASSNMKALMDVFIAQLPNCVNRELIDKAAKEFCMNLNTKLNRKRLVGALFQVQRTRLDLLPFYSRFVATLNPCMPEISTDLASLLLNDFRFHVRKKDQINIESKIKTARFIGELVKFNMFSKLDALNCLKTLLADFKHHNIEMACNLLDVCGRFLYRNQESHMKLKLLLEILMRKKQATSMDGRYQIMIENAFYYCNPPENKQVEKKVRSPLHEYIKKLLYKDLNKLCVEKILRQMRRINWDDEDLCRYALKCLIAAWNIRYNSIHCLANLVSGLALYHEEVGIQVVDGVIEDIRLGLEVNLPKYNQRRISMVKYLGELYNYRMVESSIIFKTLYTLITFGISFDIESSNNDLDPADNFFRVRLVCVLLDTCGQYFDRGTTKKKLDCFLVYFQRYYIFKKETANGDDQTKPADPMGVEYVFTETISSLRPGFKFLKNFNEANESVNKMETEIKETLSKTVPQLLKEVRNDFKSKDGGLAEDALESIKEDEEEDDEYRNESVANVENDEEPPEDEDDNEEEDDEDEDDSYNPENDGNTIKKRPSRGVALVEGEEMSNEKDESGSNEKRQRYDSLNQDSNSEMEDGMIVQPKVSKHDTSKEDDEFVKAFESVIAENIAQRTKETIKMPTVDIVVPMHLRKIKLNNSSNNENNENSVKELKSLQLGKPNYNNESNMSTQMKTNTSNVNSNNNKSKGFNFVVMIKKGNKTQYHNMEVPLASEFANQFRAREEAERVEKEKLKQLTLNINERIEQEEFQEMMQNQSKLSFSANTNRERHQKYNHPKGAPDADLIFGSNINANNPHSNKRQFNVPYSQNSTTPYSNIDGSSTSRSNYDNKSSSK